LYSMQPAESAAWVRTGQFCMAVAAAVASYVGAVIWMYERRTAGKVAIAIVAACALTGCWLPVAASAAKPQLLQLADRLTGGLVLGLVATAMLLGHWYLNSPTMKLEPLKRLIVLLAVAIGLRMLLCAVGTWLVATYSFETLGMPPTTFGLFIALRWLAG